MKTVFRMSDQVNDWIRRANSLTERLTSAASEFQDLAQTYEEMHNVHPNSNPGLDTAYRNLVAVRRALCDIQQGGKRKKAIRKTRRRRH